MNIFDRLKDGFDISDIPGIISDLQKEGKLDFGAILNSDFLKKYTKFGNLSELLAKIGISDPSQLTEVVKGGEKKGEADQVVKENSQFGSLEDMMRTALKKNQEK